jgi:transcriptional antiterminator RfaH
MTSREIRSSWFLAQLKPNCVNVAERNLVRQGFRTFLPMEVGTKRQKGKFFTALRPLFPGYIFVSFDPALGHWPAINSTYGVTRLVSFSEKPAPVPLDIMSQLMLRCDLSGKLLPHKLLKPGDLVRITTGPFADIVAKIENLAPTRRVWVLMDLMGGQTRVAIKFDQIKAVEETN